MEQTFHRLIENASQIVFGKSTQLRLALACFFTDGHLLIEDVPGMGKTTFARTLAKILGLDLQRVQFTSDLLPADIIGASIFDRKTSEFVFKPGPVFSEMLLGDEINRATPKTQSALLEAMEERQVTVEGKTHPLPKPFFVIATQNPSHQIGTFPLPESQLDRFLMMIKMEYPSDEAERALLVGDDPRAQIASLSTQITTEQLNAVKQQIKNIHAAEPVLDYLQALLHFSRSYNEFENGLSPRAGLMLLHSAKAWALTSDRDYLLPEDIQAVLPAVVNHRLVIHGGQNTQRSPAEQLIEQVPV